MRFRRWPRVTPFEDTSRKRAAFSRKQRLEREALPLFADDIAVQHRNLDDEMRHRAEWWSTSQQARRDDPRQSFPTTRPKGTVAVGSFKPNMFGLYDMAGNAAQWVQDCYHGGYSEGWTDGAAWTTGDCSLRVTRGGSWHGSYSNDLLSYQHSYAKSDMRNHEVGFRVARTLSPH
jgi:formylglycine-generating enzyme required for sulfatase activity